MKMKPKKPIDYRNQPKKVSKVNEDYRSSSYLNKYLEKKLHLHTLERKLKTQGKDLSQDEEHQKGLNQRARVTFLKTHIFQAMADLIVFFEFIRDHPELQEGFEDEIEELLMGRNKNDKSKTPAFARLVNGAIFWEYNKDPFNFRLSLLYAMQNTITLKIPSFARKDFHKHAGQFGWTISENMVRQDMDRAFAWAGFYARNTLKSETQKEWEDAHRPVLF